MCCRLVRNIADFRSRDVAAIPSTTANPWYTVLKDTKHIFGFQNVAPVLTKQLAGDATLVKIVNAVSAKLTIPAMIAMNKAVAIDKKSPAAVAAAFLKANHLS